MFCPREGPSLQTQAPRLQFCPMAGLPPQTQKPRLKFFLGMNGCCSFPLLTAPQSLFSSWTDLKRSEKILGTPACSWGECIWLSGPSGLHRSSPQRLNISSIKVFDQIWVHRCGPGGSVRACHTAGPGSIRGRDKFPGWDIFGAFPHLYDKCREALCTQGPRISFGHHYHHQSSFLTGANDLWCWRALKPQI